VANDALRYIQVGELIRSMTEDPLPHDDSLAGQTVSLAAEDGTLTRLAFSAGGGLEWEIAGVPGPVCAAARNAASRGRAPAWSPSTTSRAPAAPRP